MKEARVFADMIHSNLQEHRYICVNEVYMIIISSYGKHLHCIESETAWFI